LQFHGHDIFCEIGYLPCVAFSALTLLVGRQKEHLVCKKLTDVVLVCLERDTDDLHMVHLMPLSAIISCFITIQNGLPFWCRLTQVVSEKRPLNGSSISCWLSFVKTMHTHTHTHTPILWPSGLCPGLAR